MKRNNASSRKKSTNTKKRRRREKGTAEGSVVKNSRGFAFVIPDKEAKLSEDIFLDPTEAENLITGDRVKVSVIPEENSERLSGKLISIIKRDLDEAVGQVEVGPDGIYVDVQGKNLNLKVKITNSDEYKNLGPGKAVRIKMSTPEDPNDPLDGEIIEELADSLDHTTDAAFVCAKYKLDFEFPKQVISEALKIPSMVESGMKTKRKDLSTIPLITIDGADAKDFDDAVCAQKFHNGTFRLWVAIADVAHYVQPGSKIDKEAYKRATSVYFPNKVVPMLPEHLSNGICSLNPKVDRLAMVAEIDFDAHGKKVKHKIYEAIFRSHRRCTYEEVQEFLKEGTLSASTQKVTKNIENLYELYRLLQRQRYKRGSVDLDIQETKVLVAQDGEVTGMQKVKRLDAHRIIEECMISANEAVAEFVENKKLAMIFRTHDSPEPKAVERFVALAQSLGIKKIEGDQGSIVPKDYQKLSIAIKDHKAKRVLNFMLLRSMKQAVYTDENVGHFGLASKSYTHFTSPIRRYPDLIVHRLLKAILRSDKKYQIDLAEAGAHCSKQERIATDAEREMIRIKEVRYAQDHVGEEFSGTVVGMNNRGIFLELEELLIEGFIAVDRLPGKFFYDDKQMCMAAQRSGRTIRVGDVMKAQIARTDPQLLQIELEPSSAANGRARGKGPQAFLERTKQAKRAGKDLRPEPRMRNDRPSRDKKTGFRSRDEKEERPRKFSRDRSDRKTADSRDDRKRSPERERKSPSDRGARKSYSRSPSERTERKDGRAGKRSGERDNRSAPSRSPSKRNSSPSRPRKDEREDRSTSRTSSERNNKSRSREDDKDRRTSKKRTDYPRKKSTSSKKTSSARANATGRKSTKKTSKKRTRR